MRRRFVAALFVESPYGFSPTRAGEVRWYCDRPHTLALRLVRMRHRERLRAVLYLPKPARRGTPSKRYVAAQVDDKRSPSEPASWQLPPCPCRTLEPARLDDLDYLDELAGACWQMAEAIDAARQD